MDNPGPIDKMSIDDCASADISMVSNDFNEIAMIFTMCSRFLKIFVKKFFFR